MFRRLLLIATFLLPSIPATAETIAIIGTGDVAGALGPEFAALGHTVVYGSRNPDRDKVRALVERTGDNASAALQPEAAAMGDIVVLAVPGRLVEQVTRSLGDLSGKIIIDPTNPLIREDGEFRHAVETSNGEIIQTAAPDAHVVKAFSTMNWMTMVDPDRTGGPVSVPMVGNSSKAKKKVAEIITAMDLEPIDLGDIENARWVEGMLILWINNQFGERDAFEFHLRRTP